MPQELTWNDAEEIGIQLQEKFPEIDPLTVRFTDLHRYVTELPGFADDQTKSNESKLEPFRWRGTKSTKISLQKPSKYSLKPRPWRIEFTPGCSNLSWDDVSTYIAAQRRTLRCRGIASANSSLASGRLSCKISYAPVMAV